MYNANIRRGRKKITIINIYLSAVISFLFDRLSSISLFESEDKYGAENQ